MTPVETVQSLYAAFGRGDVGAILGKIAPDARWRQPACLPWGGEHVGPEQIGSRFFSRLNETVETTEFSVETVLAAGNEVVAYGVHVGKARATGKGFRSNWAMRWRIENGMVKFYEGFADTANVVAALS